MTELLLLAAFATVFGTAARTGFSLTFGISKILIRVGIAETGVCVDCAV